MINRLIGHTFCAFLLTIIFSLNCLAIDFLVPVNKLVPKVWNPVTQDWSNNAIKGYAETQTTAQIVEVQDLSILNSANLKVALCLHTQVRKLIPNNTYYAFTGFSPWNTTYQPANFPDGSPMPVTASSSLGSIEAMNATILSVSTPSTAQALCPNIGNDKYLGVQVVFKKINPSLNAYLLYGGKLSKVGDVLPSGLLQTTVPANRSSSWIEGLSDKFYSAVVGLLGIKLLPFDNVSLEPGIQLSKSVTSTEGQCGIDDLEETSVVSGTEVKFCFKIVNTGQSPLLNVNLNDDTLAVNLTDELSGLTDQDDDGDADDLAVGSFATAEYLYEITESIENTATASGSGTNAQDQSAVRIAICGNEIVEDGEECDSTEGCNIYCNYENLCGNETVDEGEECDSTPGCNNECLFAVCGNGIIEEEAGEQCDSGQIEEECSPENIECYYNQVPRAEEAGNPEVSCSETCQLQVCGNGIVDPGEQCDGETTESGAECTASCQFDLCGNAVLDFNEECDDGNEISGDGCSEYCGIEICGNGILNTGEQCDDGNVLSNDGCSNVCTLETTCFDTNCDPDGETSNEQECLDKEGKLNKFDRCQVCGGDGQSCITCVETNNIEGQLRMDGAAKRLADLTTKFNNKILKLNISTKLKRRLLSSNSNVNELYVTSWSLAWSLPMITKSCNTVFCTTEDLSGVVDLYQNKLDELLKEAKASARTFRRLTGKQNTVKQFLKRITEQYNYGTETAGRVNTFTSVCS